MSAWLDLVVAVLLRGRRHGAGLALDGVAGLGLALGLVLALAHRGLEVLHRGAEVAAVKNFKTAMREGEDEAKGETRPDAIEGQARSVPPSTQQHSNDKV